MIKTKRRAILKVDFKNAQGKGEGLPGFLCSDWDTLRVYAEKKNVASIFMAYIVIYCVSDTVISIPIEEIGWKWEEM